MLGSEARGPITIVLADDHTIMRSGGSSLDAIPRLKVLSANMAIVVLTMEHDPALAREASRAGAGGFVLKDAAKGELARAIRKAVRDGT